MSWPWLVVLVLAAVTSWSRSSYCASKARFGAEARRERDRARRKKSSRSHRRRRERDEFIKSVQRDLDAPHHRGARPKDLVVRKIEIASRGFRGDLFKGGRFAAAVSHSPLALADREGGRQRARVREDARHVLGVLRLLIVGDTQSKSMPARRQADSGNANRPARERRRGAAAVDAARSTAWIPEPVSRANEVDRRASLTLLRSRNVGGVTSSIQKRKVKRPASAPVALSNTTAYSPASGESARSQQRPLKAVEVRVVVHRESRIAREAVLVEAGDDTCSTRFPGGWLVMTTRKFLAARVRRTR